MIVDPVTETTPTPFTMVNDQCFDHVYLGRQLLLWAVPALRPVIHVVSFDVNLAGNDPENP